MTSNKTTLNPAVTQLSLFEGWDMNQLSEDLEVEEGIISENEEDIKKEIGNVLAYKLKNRDDDNSSTNRSNDTEVRRVSKEQTTGLSHRDNAGVELERPADSGNSNNGTQPATEQVSGVEQVAEQGVVAAEPAVHRDSLRREAVDGSSKSGNGLGNGLNAKRPTNEQIAELVNSLTTIDENSQVQLTGKITEEIKELIGKYRSGGVLKEGRGILDEYYTNPKIVEAIRRMITPLLPPSGGGEALEPSAGTGNFLSAIPQSGATVSVTAFEINDTAARIAKILHPETTVNLRSFETEFITDNGKKKSFTPKYDLVIGNPPYGEHRGLYKGLGELPNIARYEDYFVRRSMDVLKDGGVLAMVLPSSWLNRHDAYNGLEMVEAYRLPAGAFAGTQIGTDIIILRKNSLAQSIGNSRYFDEHPERVLGEIKERTNQFGRLEQYVAAPPPPEGGSKDIAAYILDVITQRTNVENKVSDFSLPTSDNSEPTTDNSEQPTETPPKIKEHKVIVINNWNDFKIPAGQIRYEMRKPDGLANLQEQFGNTGLSEDYINSFKELNYNGEFKLPIPDPYKPFANYQNGKWVHDFYYAEGDIYGKIDALYKDKANISNEQFRKQKQLLESVLPPRKSLDEINLSPNVEFVKNLTLEFLPNKPTMKEAFESFLNELPNDAFGDSSNWEVRGYVNNLQLYGRDKESNNLIKERRKKTGNDLFQKFLKEELTDAQRGLIEEAYNHRYNALYRPDYRKAPLFSQIHKHFKDNVLELTDVQLAGIGRLNVKGVGLLAHEVGFGKTLSGVLAMHEAMNKGTASRPLIVAPNDSVLKQWAQTLYEVIPNAKVNILGNLGKDYDLSGFTVNDGEISLVTYEGFKNLGFSDDVCNLLFGRFTYISQEVGEYQSEREKEREIQREKEVQGKMQRGGQYDFEALGFDHLTFDEVHNANHIVGKVKIDKNQASDFRNQTQRTSELGIKTWLAAQYIQDRYDGRNVTLLSATPFTNKPLEYYSILSLMGNGTLERMGFFEISQFFETFMEADNDLEITASGAAKEKTNVRRFKNNGLFQQLLSEFIDIKGEEDNPSLIRPQRLNREYKVQQNKLTEDVLFEVQFLLESKEASDILRGISQARLVAFSPYASSLYCGEKPDYKAFVENSPKVNAMMQLMAQNKKDKPEAGQIIYSEIGIEFFPHIKEYLVKELGYKENEIGVISSSVSQTQRDSIKDRYNAGDIKIVIGSPAIKEGIDLQRNTSDMYLLSLPYNFTQLRQVEGRSWRQGNHWERIRINYMLTDDTVDVFMLQLLQTKQSLYNEAMKKGFDTVDVSDINAGELKTALITNPCVRADIEISRERLKLNSRIAKIKADIAFNARKGKDYMEVKTKIAGTQGKIEQYRQWAEEADSEQEKEKWLGEAQYHEKNFIPNQERELAEIAVKLRKQGVDVEDFERKSALADKDIKALNEQMEALPKKKEALINKYMQEYTQEKERRSIDSFIKERAEENAKGFYALNPKVTEAEGAMRNAQSLTASPPPKGGNGEPITDNREQPTAARIIPLSLNVRSETEDTEEIARVGGVRR